MRLGALFVETRDIPLKVILDNHLSYLPRLDYIELIVHEANEPIIEYVMDVYNPKNIKVTANHRLVRTIKDYNLLMTDSNLWERLSKKCDRVLVFQSDSCLLRAGIDNFYEYDYIGASWDFHPYVGNGGLSLRNPKVMAEICTNYKYDGETNEDIYFARIVKENYYLAPIEQADKFSVETKFRLGSMGYHAIDKYLKRDQVQQIKKQYELR